MILPACTVDKRHLSADGARTVEQRRRDVNEKSTHWIGIVGATGCGFAGADQDLGRRGGSTIEVTATSRFGSDITFLDTNGSTINFVDGVAFDNTNMPFEHKGINTFGYKLSATGFNTLIAGWVRSGNSATWADATYNTDISDYDLGNGATVTLADYSGSTMPAPFNPAVNIEAGSSDLRGALTYDDTLFKLVLTVTPPEGTVFIIK